MNPTQIVAIVGLVLDVLKELERSGVLKHHAINTPALDKARAAIAEHIAAAAKTPEKKGA